MKYPNRILAVRSDMDIKITQQDLADAVGVSQPMISEYEAGESLPNAIVAELIANYLDTTFKYLYEESIDEYIADMGIKRLG